MKYYRSLKRITEPFKKYNQYIIKLYDFLDVLIEINIESEYPFCYLKNGDNLAKIRLDNIEIIENKLLNSELIDLFYKWLKEKYSSEYDMTNNELVLSCWQCGNNKPNLDYIVFGDNIKVFQRRELYSSSLSERLRKSKNNIIFLNQHFDLDGVFVFRITNNNDVRIPHCHICYFDNSIEIIYNFIENKVIKTIIRGNFSIDIYNYMLKQFGVLINKPSNMIDGSYIYDIAFYWDCGVRRRFDIDNYIRKHKIIIKDKTLKKYLNYVKFD